MNRMMKVDYKKLSFFQVLLFLFFLLHAEIVAATGDKPLHFILTQQQWSVPRTAEAVLAMPAIHQAMQALVENKKSNKASFSLLIRYPGGDEGTLWASELKGWLVSLGLASSFIELQPGSNNPEEIELLINKILY